MRKVIIQVENLEQGMNRFKTSWETGEPQGEFITFDSVETFLKTLTTKRWELLRVLQKNGPMGIRHLSRLLGRDIKNVHSDVQILKDIGLIEGDGASIVVPYDQIESHIILSSVA
ncbi:MAG: HVO_A0114 family putative DNA-binding protein [Leptospirales bacterium]